MRSSVSSLLIVAALALLALLAAATPADAASSAQLMADAKVLAPSSSSPSSVISHQHRFASKFAAAPKTAAQKKKEEEEKKKKKAADDAKKAAAAAAKSKAAKAPKAPKTPKAAKPPKATKPAAKAPKASKAAAKPAAKAKSVKVPKATKGAKPAKPAAGAKPAKAADKSKAPKADKSKAAKADKSKAKADKATKPKSVKPAKVPKKSKVDTTGGAVDALNRRLDSICSRNPNTKSCKAHSLKKDNNAREKSGEEKLKALTDKNAKKLANLDADYKKKETSILNDMRPKREALRKQYNSLPDGPEKQKISQQLYQMEVKTNLKLQGILSYNRQEAQRAKVNEQNLAEQVNNKATKSTKFSSKDCKTNPDCPLHSVKDFQGKDITDQVQKAFQGGKFQSNTYEKPTTLYRCTSGARNEMQGAGSWWSRTKPTDSAESMKRLAISKDWGTSQLKKCYTMNVPAGTAIVEGIAGAQNDSTAKGGVVKGGGGQVFIAQPNTSWMTEDQNELRDKQNTQGEYNSAMENLDVGTGKVAGYGL